MEKHPIVDKAYFMFDKEEAETIIRFFDLDTLSLLYQGQQFDHILNALLLIKSKGRITNDDRTEFNVLIYHEVPVLKMLGLLHRTSEDCIREEFKRNGITWDDLLASMSIKCVAVAPVYDYEIVIKKTLIDPNDMKPMTPSCKLHSESNGLELDYVVVDECKSIKPHGLPTIRKFIKTLLYCIRNRVVSAKYEDGIMTVEYESGLVEKYEGSCTVWHKLPNMEKCHSLKERKLCDLWKYNVKYGGAYPSAHMKIQ